MGGAAKISLGWLELWRCFIVRRGMKQTSLLLKFEAFIKFLVLKFIPLILLFWGHIHFVNWAEETYFFEKTNYPWLAAMILTALPTSFIVALFYRSLRQSWQSSKLQVMFFFIVLFFLGTIGSRVLMQLTGYLRFERDSGAIASLQEIYQAQNRFKAAHKKYATLQELAEAQLIQPRFLGEKGTQGYKYSDSNVSITTFCIHADRIKNGMGNKDFLITESGELHFIETRTKGTVLRGQGEKFYGN